MSTDGICTAICCGLCCKWYPARLVVRILNKYRYHVVLSTSTMVQYECVSKGSSYTNYISELIRSQRDADAATATATLGVVAHVSLNLSTRIRLTKALALKKRRTQSSLKKVRRWWCQHQRKWGVRVNDPPYYD
ncbi:uncharacterized protein LACBIDRAFT_317012 [Laccaria bicolor S238N-H82]|uniref:Predicted protein n=1 Tax=Laccaria bicolor (strain S238N-H82 / ATCC MYA-4686) TaxID=486041 RepID=B0D469_LACBS|nr:uncharacterized protein LACBIDRAFT_317012 [Laccaria bicolor S238N-H82]EDR10522.1 predicted protein [Laccaria bicolor S238N-H82]|eukprot:XP_001878972.1 predicted protein [Laccaria bicolor S238N-H82]